MDSLDFYGEKKWCEHCQQYVLYLMNVHHSYCVECGHEVHLFSAEDRARFNANMEANQQNRQQRGRSKRKRVS